MDPTADLIIKLGSGATGIYVLIKFMLLLEKWVTSRSSVDEKTAETSGKTNDELIRMVTSTQDRSIELLSRAMELSANTNKLVSESSWATNTRLETLATSQTSSRDTLADAIAQTAKSVADNSTILATKILLHVDENGQRIDRIDQKVDILSTKIDKQFLTETQEQANAAG